MIQQSFEKLVSSLAAKTPTPGGGAAAALSASLGAALFLMVVRFSRGKKATQEFDDKLERVEEELRKHLDRLLPMAERDCSAFDMVSKAYGLPKESDDEKAVRVKAIEEGMIGAMVVPEETLCMVRDVFRGITPVIDLVSKNIASDLGSGAHMLLAAAESAFLNIKINAAYLEDRDKANAALRQNDTVLADISDFHRTFKTKVEALTG